MWSSLKNSTRLDKLKLCGFFTKLSYNTPEITCTEFTYIFTQTHSHMIIYKITNNQNHTHISHIHIASRTRSFTKPTNIIARIPFARFWKAARKQSLERVRKSERVFYDQHHIYTLKTYISHISIHIAHTPRWSCIFILL